MHFSQKMLFLSFIWLCNVAMPAKPRASLFFSISSTPASCRTSSRIALPHVSHFLTYCTSSRIALPHVSHFLTYCTSSRIALPHVLHFLTYCTSSRIALPHVLHFLTYCTSSRIALPHVSHFLTYFLFPSRYPSPILISVRLRGISSVLSRAHVSAAHTRTG